MKLQSDPTIVYGLVGGKGTLGRGILRSRDRQGDALQHLRDRRPAAGPDRQSRPRRARGGRQPVAHQGPLFRRRRLRRPRLRRDLDQHQQNVARWRQIEKARAADAPVVDRAEPPPAAGETATPQTRGDAPGSCPARRRRRAAATRAAERPRRRPAGARGRAFDASEGTARDPLRNRTFDLNSPKTVPALKRVRPVAATS